MNVVIHYLHGKARKKPRVGDVKTVKGVAFVRVLRKAYGPGGRVIGHQVSNGRTLFDWEKLEPQPAGKPEGQG